MNKFKVELLSFPALWVKILVGGAKAGFRVEFKGATGKVCWKKIKTIETFMEVVMVLMENVMAYVGLYWLFFCLMFSGNLYGLLMLMALMVS